MAEVVRSGRSLWTPVIKVTKIILRILFIVLPFVLIYLVATNRLVLGEPYRTIVLMSVVFIVGAVAVIVFMVVMKIAIVLFFDRDEF